MDGERFDRLARVLASPTSRRQVVRGLLAAATGAILPIARNELAGSAAIALGAEPGTTRAPRDAARMQVDYYALGDSVASGHGLNDSDGTRCDANGTTCCHRSQRAYPYLVAGMLSNAGIAVNFSPTHHIACSGASSSLLHQQVRQVVPKLRQRPTGRPAIVSITMGADDFPWTDPITWMHQVMKISYPPGSDQYYAWVEQTIAGVVANIGAQIDKLLAEPNVTVILTDYPNPVNQESIFFGIYFVLAPGLTALTCQDMLGSLSCYDRVDQAVVRLNTVLAKLALARGDRVQIARVYNAFAGHESPRVACGAAPPDTYASWIQYISEGNINSYIPLNPLAKLPLIIPPGVAGDCFHPNDLGAQAYADAVAPLAPKTLASLGGPCPAGHRTCAGACVDARSDQKNCGMCGHACRPDQVCRNGKCACPAGQTDCGGHCADLSTDDGNCGRCGRVCSHLDGEICCDRRCVNSLSDLHHCGNCKTVCPAGTVCDQGKGCCPRGQAVCDNGCVAVSTFQSDPNNCGQCGHQCGSGTCSNGQCGSPCASGQTVCGGKCVDTTNDAKNCGGCGNPSTGEHVCTDGQACVNGTCQTSSPATCDPSAGCGVAGSCDNNPACICFTTTEGTGFCHTSQPCGTSQPCDTSQDCTDPAFPVCSKLTCCGTDANGKGICIQPCSAARVGMAAAQIRPTGPSSTTRPTATAEATAAACPENQLPCGSECVDTTSDPANCGGCGDATTGDHVCADGEACVTGQCQSAAGTPSSLDQQPSTPTSLSVDMGDPGSEAGHNLQAWNYVATGVVAASNGDTTCRNQTIDADNSLTFDVTPGQSYLLTTEVGDGTCDDSYLLLVNGQQLFSYQHDPSNTGSTPRLHQVTIPGSLVTSNQLVVTFRNQARDNCGLACVWYVDLAPTASAAPNAVVATANCPAGQTQCNTACVDTSADAANCGTCGNVCPSGGTCANGVCQSATLQGAATTVTGCPAGQTACNAACVDTTSDPNNCGACGNACASGSCANGQCQSAGNATAPATTPTCPDGQTSCNGACVDTGSDPANCGACGNGCGDGESCAGGQCAAPQQPATPAA